MGEEDFIALLERAAVPEDVGFRRHGKTTAPSGENVLLGQVGRRIGVQGEKRRFFPAAVPQIFQQRPGRFRVVHGDHAFRRGRLRGVHADEHAGNAQCGQTRLRRRDPAHGRTHQHRQSPFAAEKPVPVDAFFLRRIQQCQFVFFSGGFPGDTLQRLPGPEGVSVIRLHQNGNAHGDGLL